MSFAVARYETTRVTTASPVALLVALYEGAIRFLNQAIAYEEAGELGRRGVALSRAHAIVSELMVTLDADRAPELAAQLGGLYDFALHRISEATTKSDATLVKPAIDVLSSLHGAWRSVAEGGR